jgi:hypothetical protein
VKGNVIPEQRYIKKNESVEFLLSGDEIKSTGKMKEGTMPVPPAAPALRAMMTYYLFRSYRIFGGAEAAGVKPP